LNKRFQEYLEEKNTIVGLSNDECFYLAELRMNSYLDGGAAVNLEKEQKYTIPKNVITGTEKTSDFQFKKETIMQNDIKQQFPAITITETEGDISITHEFNTFEDYDNYVDLQQQLEYNSEQEEYHKRYNLCNCDGCTNGEEEEDSPAFTPEELFVINQVLGFVGGNDTVHSILNKIEPFIDEEMLSDAFDDVYVQQMEVLDGSFKLPFAGVGLQANGYELKIG
jgi:hypothetical protein